MMPAADLDAYRTELWSRLAQVNDPELDEPVTEMGFIEAADVLPDGSVKVDFRLPTYWCSPNFAFLMLDGIRRALEHLSWSPSYGVRLHDHLFADQVNRGVEAGKPFGQIFRELAGDGDLQALQRQFRMKAFRRRQEAVLVDLRRQGLSDRDIVDMDLITFDATPVIGPEAARQKPRYREALVERWPDRGSGSPAFVTWDGGTIPPDHLDHYVATLRAVRINMEFSGALCRGLKRTRYMELSDVTGEPGLFLPADGCGSVRRRRDGAD